MNEQFEFPAMQIALKNLSLKCDAPGCDHVEPIEFHQHRDAIGKPCPKCGANLLTQEDYSAACAMIAAIRAINAALPAPGEGADVIAGPRISVNPRAGALHISISDEPPS